MNNYYFLFTLVLLFNYSIRASAYASSYFDLNAIKKETNWTDVSVQKIEKLNHLSLISQSPYFYSEGEIDTNYYYPSTAGQGIDIYIIDLGVVLDHEDFEVSDKFYNGRTISCDAIVHEENGVVNIRETNENEKLNCGNVPKTNQDHGTMAASVAAGNISGVAKKANIHFIASDNTTNAHTKCVDYILKHATPGKTVVSISSSGLGYNKEDIKLLEKLTKNGFIVVVSAANDGRNCCTEEDNINFISYPGYNIAITTGAIDAAIYNDGYKKAEYSNYGKCVDVFAPGDVTMADVIAGRTAYKGNGGTSSSTPLVAGMAALIMAEQPEVTYNQESMKKKLVEMSIKDAITDLKYLGSSDTPNYFVNNGKLSVYSPRDESIECGISSDGVDHGYCNNGCCSKEGKCVKFENNPWDVCLVENGCQSEFGTCYTKEESVRQCENLLENHKECIGNPSNDANICNHFNSQKCMFFYKHIYADQTICAFVKKDESNKNRSSLDFIYNFTKETYNQYRDVCNYDVEYHGKRCINSFDQCNVMGITNKYKKSPNDIIGDYQRLKKNNCANIYENMDNLNKLIDNNPSCVRVKEKKSYDYLLKDVIHLDYYKNFVHDYILHRFELYNECFIEADNEVEGKCNNSKCKILLRDNIDLLKTMDLTKEDLKLLSKVEEQKTNFINKCRKQVDDVEGYYTCVISSDVYYTDDKYNWGYENNNWCILEENKCWSEAKGFPCCKNTTDVYYQDSDGKWGVEDDNWCGII